MNKVYLVKNLSPWMLDELLAFSNFTKFKIVFLRMPSEFYKEGLEKLRESGIDIYIKPFKYNFSIKKILFVALFFLKYFRNFFSGYSAIIGFKSLLWFLKMDLSHFKQPLSIHAQFATQASIVALMLKVFYKKEVEYYFTFHAYDIYFNNKWLSLLVDNSINSFSISQYNIDYVANNFKNLNLNKIKLSRLGVFRPEIQKKVTKRKHNTLTIGLVSWFVKKKGIRYLLEAMKELSKDREVKVKLILAGEGPLKNYIVNFILNNNLEEIIKYIGKVQGEEKRKFFEALDVFVLPAISLPNDQDGIPVVLMEAICYGLPIISTNVSGIPEICKNNFNGYLISVKNIDEIVNSIYNLITGSKMNVFSKNSFKLSNEYNINNNSKMKMQNMKWL